MSDEKTVTSPPPATPPASPETAVAEQKTNAAPQGGRPPEFGGPKGLEPTRYGDWEQKGRCTDF